MVAGGWGLLLQRVCRLHVGVLATCPPTPASLKENPTFQQRKQLHLHDVSKGWTRAGSAGGGGAGGGVGASGSNRLRVHAPKFVDKLSELAKQGQQRRLADFEDHLDDISKDWANEGVVG